MKATLILVILGLSLIICDHTDAKGFGYKRMKSPGRSMKVPKSRKGLGMGMAMGAGMGLGMGMGAALLIPVVIPMRHGYGRHRNSYRYGTQCYTCEGMDNDVCVVSPATISRRVSCPTNQYCSVLRREISFQSNGPISQRQTDANTDINSSSNDATISVAMNNSTKMIAKQTGESTRVLISRGCKSPDILQSHSMTSTRMNGDSTKTYIQFCLTDLCNVGDGRLKCYDCEGTGANHMCMVNPAEVAEVVTCQPNEYCNILRSTTVNMSVSPNNTVVESTTVSISRGCRAAGVTDDDYDAEEGTSLLSLSCSSDLCNYVDGADLAVISSATGLNFDRFCLIVLPSILILLLWQ